MSGYSHPAPHNLDAGADSLDVHRVRRDFPILAQLVYGKSLVYLDNAATSQKPQSVLDAISSYYASDNSNVHRGVHSLSMRATRAYENTRERIAQLIGAAEPQEIVFVRGATEAINLIANTYGRVNVGSGDEVLVSEMEHHSNIVPWQMLCEQVGARLRVIPMNDSGELIIEEYTKLLSPKTKLVSVVHVSNSLGTVNPIEKIIEEAHARGICVVVDGAQTTPHMAVDMRQLDCDFFVFSGHKMYGPTGIGVLYGKRKLLGEMPPYQGGGDMIASVTFDKTVYNKLPYKFEAGTPNVAGVIGLNAAIDYIERVGYSAISAHEKDLVHYANERLLTIEGLRLIGTAADKAAVVSFVLDGIHPHDVGTILDREGIAIRTGHHCTQPVMQHFDVPATSRVSLAMYNTRDEIDTLVMALEKVKEVFR